MDSIKLKEKFSKWIESIDHNKKLNENDLISTKFDSFFKKDSGNLVVKKIEKDQIKKYLDVFTETLSDNISLFLIYENNSISVIGKIIFVKELGGRIGFSHGAGIGFILNISNIILIESLSLVGYLFHSMKIQFIRKTNIFSSKIIFSTIKYMDKHRLIISNKLIDHEERAHCILEVEYKTIHEKL